METSGLNADGTSWLNITVRFGKVYMFIAGTTKAHPGNLRLSGVQFGAAPKEEVRYPNVMQVPFGILVYDLRDIIRAPEFQIVDVRSEEFARKECVRVTFKYNGEAFRFIEGWAILEPAKLWRVHKYRVTLSKLLQDRVVTVRYAENPDQPFAMESVHTESLLHSAPEQGSKNQIRDEIHFSTFAKCIKPDEAFTLSAFGFPEPSRTQEPTGESRKWLFIVFGIVLLAISIGCRAWSRRKARVK